MLKGFATTELGSSKELIREKVNPLTAMTLLPKSP